LIAMHTGFTVRRVGSRLAVVGPDSRIYGGVEHGHPESASRVSRMLEIVGLAYRAGEESVHDGKEISVSIESGRTPDGRSPAWEIRDQDGRRFAAVSKGLWPFRSGEARKLLEIVDHAVKRGQGNALDALKPGFPR
jgi:hypothetical protein